MRALVRAQDTRNAARARAILARYVPAYGIAAFLRAFRTEWARGQIAYGAQVSHIRHIRVTRRRAIVEDCIDATRAGLQVARTGTVVPGSLGSGHFDEVTELSLIHGRWLVVSQIPAEVPCGYY
jgi:hypothetical protein